MQWGAGRCDQCFLGCIELGLRFLTAFVCGMPATEVRNEQDFLYSLRLLRTIQDHYSSLAGSFSWLRSGTKKPPPGGFFTSAVEEKECLINPVSKELQFTLTGTTCITVDCAALSTSGWTLFLYSVRLFVQLSLPRRKECAVLHGRHRRREGIENFCDVLLGMRHAEEAGLVIDRGSAHLYPLVWQLAVLMPPTDRARRMSVAASRGYHTAERLRD